MTKILIVGGIIIVAIIILEAIFKKNIKKSFKKLCLYDLFTLYL